jgi:hypothetical protein
MASVNAVGGLGKHHPESGHYGTLFIRGLADWAEADEWSRALYRAAQYLTRWGIADVSMSATVRRSGGKYEIEFKAVDKTLARKYFLEKYGTDKSKWPYDPTRRNSS